MADVYRHFTAGRRPDARRKQDVFQVILACANNGKDHVFRTTSPRVLSRKQVAKIVNHYFRQPPGWELPSEVLPGLAREVAERVGEAEAAGRSDVPTVPFSALFDSSGVRPNADFDPRPALHASEVILGIDVTSRHEFVVYGRDTMEEIARSGEGRILPMLRVELDQATDELERLLALVELVKGRHDYQAS